MNISVRIVNIKIVETLKKKEWPKELGLKKKS